MKKLKSEKGQALVEFALIVPIMMTIFCAIVDFGWVFLNQLSITSMAREGAREGITCAGKSNYQNLIKEKINGISSVVDADEVTYTISLSNTSHPSSGDITVKLDYKVSMLTPMGILVFGDNEYAISGKCTMKVEQ